MKQFPTNCDRCGTETRVFKMSRFNKDMLCTACVYDEKEAPGYKIAADEEHLHLLYCDYNYPGVGLGPLDLGFVCGRMALRGIGSDITAAYAKKHGYPYPENNLPDHPVK